MRMWVESKNWKKLDGMKRKEDESETEPRLERHSESE